MKTNLKKTLLVLFFSIGFSTFLHAQTTVTLRPDATTGKDAVIDSKLYDNNFGNHTDFFALAMTNGGTPVDGRSLIDFDLSVIPSGSTINSASLSLYSYNSPSNGSHCTISGSNESDLRRITSTWDENTVTWNNQPSTTDQNKVTLPESTSAIQDYMNINVTDLIQDMHDDPSNSYGLLFKLVTEDYYRGMVFGSSDNADSDLHPRLEITYTYSDTIQHDNCIIDVPTAFSPNGDGQNDILYVRGSGYTGFEFMLYNRLGQLVFNTKNNSDGWDGTYNREKQESEVYFYILKATCVSGEKINKTGNITLLN